MFLLLATLASDLPIGDVFKNTKVVIYNYLLLRFCTCRTKMETMVELSLSYSPEGATVTPPSMY